jgi:hypothetical protein
MADLKHPLPLATVIWFGSLEFMSLGYNYDMVLLPPRHPTDHDYELSHRGGALCRYHRSHRARTARRRHAQRSHHHRLMEDDTMLHSGAPRPDTHTTSLVEDLCRMSLATGETSTGDPIISPSGAAPLVGSRSVSSMAGSMPPQTFPYGLNTAAQQYASSVSANMRVYGELLGHHLRSALDLVASTPASEYQDSKESSGTEHRVIASSRYDPRDR